jgi:protein TonB
VVDTPRIGLEGVDEMTRRLQQRPAQTPGSAQPGSIATVPARDQIFDPASAPSQEPGVLSDAAPPGQDQPARFSDAANDSAGGRPIRVGGNIRQPTKIRDVKPVYPPIAAAAKVSGVVILEATIGGDGRVVDARVIRSIPLLDQAALDAVRQWEFVPTLLNGVPALIIMSVTVNFALN